MVAVVGGLRRLQAAGLYNRTRRLVYFKILVSCLEVKAVSWVCFPGLDSVSPIASSSLAKLCRKIINSSFTSLANLCQRFRIQTETAIPLISFVTVTHFLRKTGLVRRQTHLAVIIFPNEASAFQAYRLLHHYGISPEHLAIVGQGYSSPEHVGLLKPMQIATRKARTLSIFAGLLGSIVGLILFLAQSSGYAELHSFRHMLVVPACGIMSGFFGAVVGGLFGLFGEGTTVSVYRHHLNRGQYLLMMEGSEKLVRWGQEVLSQYSTSKSH